MLHHHEHPFRPDGEIHRAADSRDRVGRAGMPVGEVTGDGHLESAENANIEVPAAHHGEGIGVMKV